MIDDLEQNNNQRRKGAAIMAKEQMQLAMRMIIVMHDISVGLGECNLAIGQWSIRIRIF